MSAPFSYLLKTIAVWQIRWSAGLRFDERPQEKASKNWTSLIVWKWRLVHRCPMHEEPPMKLTFAALAVCCTLLPPLEAHATSANDLLQLCKEMQIETKSTTEGRISFPLTFGNGLCWGFFDAFGGLSRLQSDTGNKTILYICAPADTTLTQFVRTFIEYAENNTQRLNEPAEIVALLALNKAYPCR
jgi:hypothetical protein